MNNSYAMRDIEVHRRRVELAANNNEPYEVLCVLLLDGARCYRVYGFEEDALQVERVARAMKTKFGIRESFDRARLGWWGRYRYSPPDYESIVEMYRNL